MCPHPIGAVLADSILLSIHCRSQPLGYSQAEGPPVGLSFLNGKGGTQQAVKVTLGLLDSDF